MRFYTRIDDKNLKKTKWPWQLATIKRGVYRRCLLRYRHWKHAIVDSGVEIFFNQKSDDYPQGFYKQHIIISKYLTRIFGFDKVWVTIPDFPDDYNPGFIKNNVERTLKNIEIYHPIKEVNWLYPLQAKYLDLDSFRHACEVVKGYEPKQVAIGTVCKTRNSEFIIKCIKLARRMFPNVWLHAFVPTLTVLPKIVNLLDSFDSTAYFTSRKPGQGMCRNREERYEYFLAYLSRVKEIISKKQIAKLTQFFEPDLIPIIDYGMEVLSEIVS